MNRKLVVLASLLAVLGLSVIYAFWAMPRQEHAPPRDMSRPPAKVTAAGKAGSAPAPAGRLNLGLLAEKSHRFPGAERDIFRFRGGWAPPVGVVPPSVPPVIEEAPPPPPPPPTALEILQQQVAKFTFLGFLQKGGDRTVFLSSGGSLFLVKAGDRFGRQHELVAREITDTELVVGSVTGAETVRVKLVEKQALKPGSLFSGGDPSGSAQGLSTAPRQGATSFPGRGTVPQQRFLRRPAAPTTLTEADEELEGEDDEPTPPDDSGAEEESPQEVPASGEGDGNKN